MLRRVGLRARASRNANSHAQSWSCAPERTEEFGAGPDRTVRPPGMRNSQCRRGGNTGTWDFYEVTAGTVEQTLA